MCTRACFKIVWIQNIMHRFGDINEAEKYVRFPNRLWWNVKAEFLVASSIVL